MASNCESRNDGPEIRRLLAGSSVDGIAITHLTKTINAEKANL